MNSSGAAVLLVDDHWEELSPLLAGLPSSIRLLTESHASRVVARLAADQSIGTVLLDLRFDDQATQGTAALDDIKERYPQLPVIVLTAVSDVELALRLVHMEKKARYYFVKDRVDPDQLVQAVENAVSYYQLLLGKTRMTDRGPIIGQSSAMLEVLRLVGRAALSDLPVLITGEPGTGKELIARAIHFGGPTVGAPFLPINCAAIPNELVESELFGTHRGGFTQAVDRKGAFELAGGGTILLDEVGELPPSSQAALLRAVEHGEIQPVGGRTRRVKVRVVAATNLDLEDAMKRGVFRQDLYHRLNVLRVHLPPLRERAGDIRLLAEYALAARHPGRSISPEALIMLNQHAWPGNVRELMAAIDQATALTDDQELGPVVFAQRLSPGVGRDDGGVDSWVARILTGEANWAVLKREFKGSGATLRTIIDSLIWRWKTERGERPSGGELATLLGTNRNHINQILDQLDLRLRSYDE